MLRLRERAIRFMRNAHRIVHTRSTASAAITRTELVLSRTRTLAPDISNATRIFNSYLHSHAYSLRWPEADFVRRCSRASIAGRNRQRLRRWHRVPVGCTERPLLSPAPECRAYPEETCDGVSQAVAAALTVDCINAFTLHLARFACDAI